MKFYKVTGVLLIITSAVLFTIERVFSMISTSIAKSGFYAGGWTGTVPEIEVNGFFDNIYVPILLLAGIVCFIYGLRKETE